MATFKIDDVEYDTENLDTTQKRVVGLYQKSLQDEGEALNQLRDRSSRENRIGQKAQGARNRQRQEEVTSNLLPALK